VAPRAGLAHARGEPNGEPQLELETARGANFAEREIGSPTHGSEFGLDVRQPDGLFVAQGRGRTPQATRRRSATIGPEKHDTVRRLHSV